MNIKRVRRIVCCTTCRKRFVTRSGSTLCLSCRQEEDITADLTRGAGSLPFSNNHEGLEDSAIVSPKNDLEERFNFGLEGSGQISMQQTFHDHGKPSGSNKLVEVIAITSDSDEEKPKERLIQRTTYQQTTSKTISHESNRSPGFLNSDSDSISRGRASKCSLVEPENAPAAWPTRSGISSPLKNVPEKANGANGMGDLSAKLLDISISKQAGALSEKESPSVSPPSSIIGDDKNLQRTGGDDEEVLSGDISFSPSFKSMKQNQEKEMATPTATLRDISDSSHDDALQPSGGSSLASLNYSILDKEEFESNQKEGSATAPATRNSSNRSLDKFEDVVSVQSTPSRISTPLRSAPENGNSVDAMGDISSKLQNLSLIKQSRALSEKRSPSCSLPNPIIRDYEIGFQTKTGDGHDNVSDDSSLLPSFISIQQNKETKMSPPVAALIDKSGDSRDGIFQSSSENSSVLSNDSIWNETGFESKEKEERIAVDPFSSCLPNCSSEEEVVSLKPAPCGISSPLKNAPEKANGVDSMEDISSDQQNLSAVGQTRLLSETGSPHGTPSISIIGDDRMGLQIRGGDSQEILPDDSTLSSSSKWGENQPIAIPESKEMTATTPAAASIDISDDSQGDALQSSSDDSLVSSDDSIWNKKGFESKQTEESNAVDPSNTGATSEEANNTSHNREDLTANKHFHCYLLRSLDPSHPRKTYIGFTTHPLRRIRQHNGILKSGGARRTKRSGRPWTFTCVIHGFEDKITALQFEWAWQNIDKSEAFLEAVGCELARKMKRRPGPKARLDELRILLKDCLPFSLYSLTVYFSEREYHDIFSGMLRRGKNGNPYKPDEGESDAYESLIDVQVCSLENMPAAREAAALKEKKKAEREARKAQNKKKKSKARAKKLPGSAELVADEEGCWFDTIRDDNNPDCSKLKRIEESNSSVRVRGNSPDNDERSLDGQRVSADEDIRKQNNADGASIDFLSLSKDALRKDVEKVLVMRGESSSLSSDDSRIEISVNTKTVDERRTAAPLPHHPTRVQSLDDISVSLNGSLYQDDGPYTSQQKDTDASVEEIVHLDDAANQSFSCNNSVSSDDSIWNKRGFERKQKEGRIDDGRVETYYDYFRLQNKTKARNGQKNRVDHVSKVHDETKESELLLPEVPLPENAIWRIVLLMDHREFGCRNNFLQMVENKINKKFGDKHAEITTLTSADYLYVARLISNTTGEIVDERVLDVLIERKAVQDACQCLVADSKKFKPLSFFEAQMYKMQQSGMSKKIFLMEGDEDSPKNKNLFQGCKSQKEKDIRLKRIKTLRMQLANGEFEGVDLVCTRSRSDTIKFLTHQLDVFRQSFNGRRPPTKTREQLKNHINDRMKMPTFLEYLRLRSIPGIGDAKAMKIITDPQLDWDKSFVSPSSSKKSKATLEYRAKFWVAP